MCPSTLICHSGTHCTRPSQAETHPGKRNASADTITPFAGRPLLQPSRVLLGALHPSRARPLLSLSPTRNLLIPGSSLCVLSPSPSATASEGLRGENKHVKVRNCVPEGDLQSHCSAVVTPHLLPRMILMSFLYVKERERNRQEQICPFPSNCRKSASRVKP